MANPENLTGTWKPGQSGNPGGKTSEQKRREMRNAEMATRLREAYLEREIEIIENPITSEQAIAAVTAMIEAGMDAKVAARVMAGLEMYLTPDRLKLIKDSEDRGLGTPKSTSEIQGEGGGPLRILIDKSAD